MHSVLLVIHVIVTLLLIGIILIQRSDGDALGLGGGGSNIMSGRTSANLLTRTTAILATLFILTSLALTLYTNKMTHSTLLNKLQEQPSPATSAPAGANAPLVPVPDMAPPAATVPPAAPAPAAAKPVPATTAPAKPIVPRPE